MSIFKTNEIDAIGITKDGEGLVLMIADAEDFQNEHQHLKLLQDKINSYIAFLTDKQYEAVYPDKSFKYAVIETHFRYEPTENTLKFLQVVQDQVGQFGIRIQCEIAKEN